MNKKIIMLSIISSVLINLTGCSMSLPSSPNMKDLKKDAHIKSKLRSIDNKLSNVKSIERIYVKDYIYKQMEINHNIPDILNIKLEVNFTQGMTLKDFSKRIGLPSVVEDSISMNEICFNGILKGNLIDILNSISEITNVYWTYESGVIKFQRTANIIYSFPFFSMERLQTVFNTGGNSNDQINMNVAKGVFEELENGLKISLDEVTFKGTIDRKWNNNKIYSIKNKKESLISSLESNAKKQNDIELKNVTKSDNNNNYMLNKNEDTNENGSSLPKVKFAKKNKDAQLINPVLSKNNKKVSLSNVKKSFKKGLQNSIQNKKDSKIDKLDNNKNESSDIKDKANDTSIEKKIEFTRTYGGGDSKISISKELGVVFARLTPNEEKRASHIMRTIMKKHFSSMVVMDTYILSVNSEKIKDYSMEFGAILQNGLVQSSFNISQGLINFKQDSITLPSDPTAIPVSGKIMSGVLNYFIGDSSGEILSEPKIVTMQNTPARIKDTRFYPYVEPQQITGDSGNSVSYSIANVEEGIDLTVLPTVLSDDTIFISIGLSINEYLGDKTIQAGIAGTFNLPQQAPKKLNTTFRIKPGDIIVLGGIKSSVKQKREGSQVKIIPVNDFKKQSRNEFLIVAMPRLIKFIEEKNRKSEEILEKKERLEYDQQILNGLKKEKEVRKNQNKEINSTNKKLNKSKIFKKPLFKDNRNFFSRYFKR